MYWACNHGNYLQYIPVLGCSTCTDAMYMVHTIWALMNRCGLRHGAGSGTALPGKCFCGELSFLFSLDANSTEDEPQATMPRNRLSHSTWGLSSVLFPVEPLAPCSTSFSSSQPYSHFYSGSGFSRPYEARTASTPTPASTMSGLRSIYLSISF